MELLDQRFLGNELSEWLISLALLVGLVILIRIVYGVFKRVSRRVTNRTATQLDDIIVDKVEEPIVFIVSVAAIYIVLERLSFGQVVDQFIGDGIWFGVNIGITWLLVRLSNALMTEFLTPYFNQEDSSVQDQRLPIIQKMIVIIIWAVGVLIALNNAGYNVGALLAGLGIGGVAFALAAKDTISNFFGGIIILIDKPFNIGDRIKVAGYDGNVVSIGLRSTRLRTLENRMVTIPNLKFIDGIVENVSSQPSQKMTLKIGLVYNTTPEQIEEAMNALHEINDRVQGTDKNCVTSFTDFGDFALGIHFIYYITPEGDYFNTQSEINLGILKEFNKKGLEFAFPTQTIHTEMASFKG
ncbi:MAG TPA: mechanosensitive ion channel family protein [Flavobacteriales bacterium]|nr:mechanosensitive ion channel family protein [Flavobacteriales bacterium]